MDDKPEMRFVRVAYKMSSSDAERIGVNSAAEVTTGAVGANSALARHYTGLRGSLAMLTERLQHLIPLLQKMEAGEVPMNHQVGLFVVHWGGSAAGNGAGCAVLQRGCLMCFRACRWLECVRLCAMQCAQAFLG